MKISLYILAVFSFMSSVVFAQNTQKTIVDDLNSSKWGQGNIKVMQDEAIQNIVAVRHAETQEGTKASGTFDPSANYVKVKGFKIQVFMGNNQQRSRREAEYKQSQVRGAFPQYEAVVSFQSPFWRLRVGNFLTRAEAQEALSEMKTAFPAFGKEMTVVADVVKRPVE